MYNVLMFLKKKCYAKAVFTVFEIFCNNINIFTV